MPQQAWRRSRVTGRVMHSLELFGYDRVGVPPFEYVEVVEGPGAGTSSESLRFVEPESGEVVALRADVTPQIARLVASRLAEGPWPLRLSYQATVMRRRQERARLDRQIFQVGFELIGREGPAGDLETLEAAVAALKAAGLTHFTVDLAHAGIAGSLLRDLPQELRPELLESLSVKDGRRVHDLAHAAGLRGPSLRALSELPALHGKAELWPRAAQVLSDTPALPALRSLEALWRSATEAQLAPDVIVDLGETREFFYYSGIMFHLLAEGPGEPVGSGGRYDTLFDRFGLDVPAAGFAFDLSHVCWALDRSGFHDPTPTKVLVVPHPQLSQDACAELLRRLRRRGVACAQAPIEMGQAAADPPAAAQAYAQRQGYSHLLSPSPLGHAHLSPVLAAGAETPAPRRQRLEAPDFVRLAEVVSAQLEVLTS